MGFIYNISYVVYGGECMNEPLTLDWIIATLKKSGVNSKKLVIDRLENASHKELYELYNSCLTTIYQKHLFVEDKNLLKDPAKECPIIKFAEKRKEISQ